MFNKMNFITETSLKVLSLLASDPMKEFYQREIAREANVSIGAVNQILRTLAEREIVTEDKRGRMIFYRYNIQNLVSRQLKILFNVNDISELIGSIRERCKRIVLFGSAAEGSDVKGSDLDLFVLTQEKDAVRRAIKEYEEEIGRRIAPIIMNASEFIELRSKDKALHDRILEGIVLWQIE
jgi:predicted nucleotidyltransferase